MSKINHFTGRFIVIFCRIDNVPVFVLSSHVKEAMAKTEPIIPEAIYNQL